MSDKKPDSRQIHSKLIPQKIVLIYLVVAILWILFSDRVLVLIAPNLADMVRLQSVKGSFYVLITALMLYWLIRRGVNSIHHSQDAEQKSEQGYRQLMEQSANGIFVADAQGNYIDVNPKGLEILGYDRAELLRFNLADIIDPDQLSASPVRMDELRRGESLVTERLLRRKDGSRICVEITAKMLSDGRMFSTVRDITERKQAEDIQRQIKEVLLSLHEITSNAQVSFSKKVQQLLKLGSEYFQLPIGVLSHIEGQRYEVIEVLAPAEEVGKGMVFDLAATCCQVTVQSSGPLGFRAPTEAAFSQHLGISGFQVQSYFGVLVIAQNRVYGTLNFFGFEPRVNTFLPADEAILKLMAQWIGGEIARSWASAEIHHRNRELALLNRVIAVSVNTTEPEIILETACRELSQAFALPRVSAMLLNEIDLTVTVVAEILRDNAPSALYRVFHFLRNSAMADSILTRKSPMVITDARKDARLGEFSQILTQLNICSMLILPLQVDRSMVGALLLSAHNPRAFSSDEVTLAWRVADQVAGALARERLARRHRRLITAIEQTADSVIIADTSGNTVYVNPAFEQNSGYSMAEVLGKKPHFFEMPVLVDGSRAEVWETLNVGLVWNGRLIDRKKDGSEYTVDASVSPVRDENGIVVNYVSVQRDVTRELQLEAQYLQAQKMEAVGRLTGGIAHDFNNLLTAINGFAELTQISLSPDDPQRELIDKILHSGQRATSLIQQLMAFSRNQIVEPQVIDINRVVAELEKMLRRVIGEHIQMTVNLFPALWSVKIDPTQLEQIVVNLAVNASDAMSQGGQLIVETGNVTLDAIDTHPHVGLLPGEYVMLAVSDTGQGMSREVQEHIFEPFFTTKEMGKGTGLGLSTVFGIVKQCQGDIQVTSELGQGTTFKIYLPRAHHLSPLKLPEPRPFVSMRTGTETILLVEDDPAARELFVFTLRGQGYIVIEATNGLDALEKVRAYQGKIDLVLTDVVMPKMGGRELVEELARISPRTRVIFTSGYTDNVSFLQGKFDNGVPFIQKPFSPIFLAQKVRDTLDKVTEL